jgi:hypothetical protein
LSFGDGQRKEESTTPRERNQASAPLFGTRAWDPGPVLCLVTSYQPSFSLPFTPQWPHADPSSVYSVFGLGSALPKPVAMHLVQTCSALALGLSSCTCVCPHMLCICLHIYTHSTHACVHTHVSRQLFVQILHGAGEALVNRTKVVLSLLEDGPASPPQAAFLPS